MTAPPAIATPLHRAHEKKFSIFSVLFAWILTLVLIGKLPGFADGRREPDDEIRWDLPTFEHFAIFFRDIFDGIDMDIVHTRLRANIPFNAPYHLKLLVRLPAVAGHQHGAKYFS